MSAVSSRPKVHSVTSASLTAAALGVAAVGVVILEALRHAPHGQRLAADLRPRVPEGPRACEVQPLGLFDQRLRSLEGRLQGLGDSGESVDAIKLQVLQSLSSMPCLVSAASCAPAVQALANAATAQEARATAAALLQQARTAHVKVTEHALSVACRAAAEDVGFRPVASAVGADGALRLLASDTAGRALVTEIRHGADGMPAIETEVLGVGDGACHGLLDKFDDALASHGVRAGAPERRDTGGVAALAASKGLAASIPATVQTVKVRSDRSIARRAAHKPRTRAATHPSRSRT